LLGFLSRPRRRLASIDGPASEAVADPSGKEVQMQVRQRVAVYLVVELVRSQTVIQDAGYWVDVTPEGLALART
jgi:hypothetical protein